MSTDMPEQGVKSIPWQSLNSNRAPQGRTPSETLRRGYPPETSPFVLWETASTLSLQESITHHVLKIWKEIDWKGG